MHKLKSHPALYLNEKAIFSPRADFALTSGISLLVMIGLLLYYALWYQDHNINTADVLPKLLILQVLLNWSHFLISYRILYQKKENFKDFPFATIIVPSVLLAVCLGATLPIFGGTGFLSVNIQIAYILWMLSALYLAWHYTGQAWGMMSIYSHLSGVKFRKHEIFVLRNGLRVLIGWHVIWALPPFVLVHYPLAQTLMNILAVFSFVSGSIILMVKSREQSLDIRIVGAWLVTFLWYLVLYLMPKAFVFIQISHAMQYLIFPARVELNRDRHKSGYGVPNPKLRLILIYLMSVAGGLLIFYLPDLFSTTSADRPTFAALIAISINIHHYYTDGAIWKMRKGGARELLFNHLPKSVSPH